MYSPVRWTRTEAGRHRGRYTVDKGRHTTRLSGRQSSRFKDRQRGRHIQREAKQ